MKKTDKILGGIGRKIAQLEAVAEKEKANADKIREQAKKCYAAPDKAMEIVYKIVNELNAIVKSINRKAFNKAQELGRKAGQCDEEAERASRVAGKFSELVA